MNEEKKTKEELRAEIQTLRQSLTQSEEAARRQRAASDRRAEAVSERLRSSEERFRVLCDAAPLAIFQTDVEGRCTYVNQRWQSISSFSTEETLGYGWSQAIHPEDRPALLASWKVAVAEGRPWSDQYRLVTRKGDERIVRTLASPMHAPDGRFIGHVGTLEDVTDRQRLEAQFRQAQKMEAVGRLAGGVAHDFNNLLTVVMGYSELVLSALPPEDPACELIEGILKAGERAATLTHQLLAFSRKQVLAPVVLDLNAIVRDMEKMLPRLVGEDIVFHFALAPVLRQVKADPGQIEQVLMNLIVNARDAMPDGGKLTIETGNIDLDASYTQKRPEVQPGRYALLAVSDTGIGMDAATKVRIFEPFFTTKEVGKGTGLGLATAYGIVKQSGGYIYVYSEPGHGTTFKIYLPEATEGLAASSPASAPEASREGTETILLVEDDEPIRALARLVLQTKGYTVLEANNGHEALRLSAQYDDPIHLLVTDVIMPGMSGRQLSDRLLAQCPTMKMLFLSGYTDDAIVHHGVLEPGTAFLQKPFTPNALARKVREVLDK